MLFPTSFWCKNANVSSGANHSGASRSKYHWSLPSLSYLSMYSPNKVLNANTSVLTSYENAKRGRHIRSNEPSVYEKYPQTSFPFLQNRSFLIKVLVRRCIICPKLRTKALENPNWHCFGEFIINSGHISNIVLVFLFWTLNR